MFGNTWFVGLYRRGCVTAFRLERINSQFSRGSCHGSERNCADALSRRRMAEGDSAEPFYMEPGELFKLVHEERAWVMMMLFICSCRNSNNRSTCPPFSTPPPLANSFVLGTAIINTQPAHRYIPIGYSPRGINESCRSITIRW